MLINVRTGRHRRVAPRRYTNSLLLLRRSDVRARRGEPGGVEIGLGSRQGDVDWLGRRRAFTADDDMGVWVAHDSERPREVRHAAKFAVAPLTK